VKVVRVTRLGGDNRVPNVSDAEEFQLKQSVCDLFTELARLQNGTVVRLEFRHGLPFLLEIAMYATGGEQISAPRDQPVSKTDKNRE
jgi:hypothetical protein